MMSPPTSSERSRAQNRWALAWIWLATAILIALLVVLALMQLRWLSQVSDADEMRTRRALEASLEAVARDFNRQLIRIFVDLQPARVRWLAEERRPLAGDDDLAVIASLLERHRQQVDFPHLIARLYAVSNEKDGVRLFSVDDDVAPLETWPASLEPVAEQLAAWRQEVEDHQRSRHRPRHLSLLYGDIPALLIPLHTGRPFADEVVDTRKPGPAETSRSRRGRRRPRTPGLFLVAELNSATILEEVLPGLAARHLGSEIDFRLNLVSRSVASALADGRSDDPPAALWSMGPDSPTGAVVEAEQPIFGPLASGDRAFGRGGSPLVEFGAADSEWVLRASHPAGSLVAAVKRNQRRQAAVACSILGVLGLALVLAVRAAMRSRSLAQQQLSVVAGITHELMTPLAALRSAGQNLADGVVTDGQRVARYGRMIDREGLRLSQLVSQVLAFARMQTGAPDLKPRALSVQTVVDDVLAELQPTLDEDPVEFDISIDPGAPNVLADPQAISRVLVNLMSNALKYGRPGDGSGMWVGLAVLPCGDDRVCFEVRDRGPGIAPADLPHLFEPFYRGRGLEASNIAGSGLGLALVKHLVTSQGGTINVRHEHTELHTGTVFRFELPATDASDSRKERS